MSQSIPWVGHSGKLKKRRKVCQQNMREPATTSNPEGSVSHTHDVSVDKPSTGNDVPNTTKSGRQVKTSARFLYLNKPAGPFRKRKEVVGLDQINEEKDHVRRDTCARELLDW